MKQSDACIDYAEVRRKKTKSIVTDEKDNIFTAIAMADGDGREEGFLGKRDGEYKDFVYLCPVF